MSAAVSERKIGSTIGTKYRLLRVLGRGGMGVVYEAEHTMTRRRVAVKVLHAHHREQNDAAKRFINEAQAAGKISHPNVVEVLDAGEDNDGSLYLVLELLHGHDLATLLVRKRRLEVAETVAVIAQVLQALVVAHRQGIIHRDIKPENIFLIQGPTGDTQVKLLDFGISKAIDPTQGPALNVTQTNTTVGTPHYMAPEQARGERNIDQRADLWATAVVTYECLAGRVPFEGDTYNDQIVRVITDPHIPLANYDVPLELSRIVDRALEKHRERRFPNAAEMLADLRKFIERHREYSSVPAYLLREPVVNNYPTTPSLPPNAPTVETTHDPANHPGKPPASDTVPSAPAAELATLIDSVSDDAPTKVRDPVSASGERPVNTPKRQQIIIAVGLLFTAVLIGTVAAVMLQHRPNSTPNANAATSLLVRLRFSGIPSNARLIVGGVPVYNSDSAVVPRATRATTVEISAPGFRAMRFEVVPDQDRVVPVQLVAEPSANPAPNPVPNPPTPTPTPAPVVVPSVTDASVVPSTVDSDAGPSATVDVAATPSATVDVTEPPHTQPDLVFSVETDAGAAHPNTPAPTPRQPVSTQPTPAVTPNTTPTPRSTIRPLAPTPTPGPAVSPTQAVLVIRSSTPCNIAIDGQVRGRSATLRVTTTPGLHRVLCGIPGGGVRSQTPTAAAGREVIVNFE